MLNFQGLIVACLFVCCFVVVVFLVYIFSEEAFSALKNKLVSSSLMLFLPSSGTILPGSVAREAKLSTILPERFKMAGRPPKAGNGQSGLMSSEEPVSVELVESAVGGGGSELPGGPALSVKEPVDGVCVCVHVPLDCLALASWDSSVSDLVSCFKMALCRQLESVRDHIFWKVSLLVFVVVFPFS